METEKDFYMAVAIHPGELLTEWIEEKGVPIRELALRANYPEAALQRIADGAAPIASESAAALEQGTGITARFWLRSQLLYENTLEHLAREKAEKVTRKAARRIVARRHSAELAPAGV